MCFDIILCVPCYKCPGRDRHTQKDRPRELTWDDAERCCGGTWRRSWWYVYLLSVSAHV